jgi:ribosomal protein L29
MKKLKKELRKHSNQELIEMFVDLEKNLKQNYPRVKLKFDFDNGFFKKFDVENVKKNKRISKRP